MTTRSFTRQHRLLSPRDFQRVMDKPLLRATQNGFLLLACENELDVARIGFVLSKRRVRLAVARNRIKRIIRESFRQQQDLLRGLDIVVMARDGLATLENPALHAAIERQFQHLVKKRSLAVSPPAADNTP
jgi:ribonuclease P protein component